MLPAGTRLGPYEIVSSVGSGGMGDVYRARDTRLAREIALKVLPLDFAGDPDRMRRFEAEARAASRLNHPNVVTIHDIGREDDFTYIAMETVEGESLRARIARGTFETREAVELARQVSERLAEAHG